MEITINKQGHNISALEIKHPMGGVAWIPIKDDGERGYNTFESSIVIVKEYMEKFYHEGARLSICDLLKEEAAEIHCPTKDIPRIVEEISILEQSAVGLVGYNKIFNSYIIGMILGKNHLREGHYLYKDGELRRILSLEMSENCLTQEGNKKRT